MLRGSSASSAVQQEEQSNADQQAASTSDVHHLQISAPTVTKEKGTSIPRTSHHSGIYVHAANSSRRGGVGAASCDGAALESLQEDTRCGRVAKKRTFVHFFDTICCMT
ncbi:unnamed protein product [Pedinophyceae sp. YPF-701]|nr:unnamed protein product [Pedinophyceae sp. YPF-701]